MTPFPLKRQAVTLDPTTSSVRATLPPGGNVVLVKNEGTTTAFVTAGSASVAETLAATTSDMPVLPGATEPFSVDESDAVIAAIRGSGTGKVYVVRGYGQ